MREYRNVTTFTDRLGVKRWRFRKTGHKTRMLPGQPGEDEFEAAYDAIIAGMALPAANPAPAPSEASTGAEITRHPKAALPKSLRAAWLIVTTSTPEWKRMQFDTRARQSVIAESFLNAKVNAKLPTVWGDVPIAELRRRHIKAIIAERQVTLHVTKQLLGLIRKMVSAAMDAEWIDVDPTYGISFQPEYKGWRAWTREEMEKFEERWPIGTTPRLAYSLALWLGNRRGDVCSLTVDAIGAEGVRVVQGKTGRPLLVPITPMLRDVLSATNLSEGTILKTIHGKPFSAKSITGRMQEWTRMAGLRPGCTLHGLRKTLGKMLAEGGATTRQIMDTLGHTNIKYAELYSKEADQQRLSRDGMDKVVRMFGRGKIESA